MAARLGISGWRASLTAAIHHGGRLAVCEEGRLRRVRRLGAAAGGWPSRAIAACAAAHDLEEPPRKWRAAEPEFLELNLHGALLDHHEAHARTAFGTSGFHRAVVVVCDSRARESESLWLGSQGRLERLDIQPPRPGIARRLMEAGDPRELEFLARNPDESRARESLETCADDVLRLLEAADAYTESTPICGGGGLFLNGFINLRLRQAGYWLHVPPDPGNGGLSVGCALPDPLQPFTPGPFLGPSFSNDEIKRVLDNCKIRYDYVSDSEALARTLNAILRGQLVAWFQGAMEWGPRALGHRCILANPFSKYVSDNLNTFLKHRPPHHTYPLSILEDDLETLLTEPVASPFMESEAVVIPGGPLGPVAQRGDRLRVQTVRRDGSPLSVLLEHFRGASGYGALVNTSFNGFHEPIVATPRDAVRVFYGTGLDALSIGSFWLEK